MSKQSKISPRQALALALDAVTHSVRRMGQAGLKGFECSPRSMEIMGQWNRPLTTGAETLDYIRNDLGDCQRCKLARGRTHIVFGEGNSKARLVFVGEGPGREEDLSGKPFVGRAGQLLTRIIEAIQLRREEVYICNVVKCRPPGDRNPEPDEIGPCLPFLIRQLQSIQPQFICTLGKVATNTLLQTEQPISRVRGTLHDFMGIQLMPTYHPAYLLRNERKKREVWEDMKLLMRLMGMKSAG